ncbi:uncharacterized protein N7496_009440 [Penicillium cataractarum]|uniref:Restriction endonuclease domain-containing protein n=1 Tax=Penicillium cataractarum TaxID=2100454 RepID=A0A9W9RP23_9EURO|nr:uncharacterized protein N7496_009440 [Penicillium cataractarum]KAJ5363727.1 hypothetical protein N7496_009440 [Penicillium cataractarum]
MSKTRFQPQPESPPDSGVELISPTDLQSSKSSLPESWELTAVISAKKYNLSYESLLRFVLGELKKWTLKESDLSRSDLTREVAVYYFTEIPSEFNPSEADFSRITWDSKFAILRVKMPTEGHDLAQTWIQHSLYLEWMERTKTISPHEASLLQVQVGTTLELPTSPFTKSKKQPDCFLRPLGSSSLPPIVLEVGWSESRPRLIEDMELLLQGGGGQIQVVILINWSLRQNKTKVAGTVELWRLGQNGQPSLQQSESIFPSPNTLQPQHLEVTFGEVFQSQLLPSRNSSDKLYLDIDLLSDIAVQTFQPLRLSPAP